MSTFVSHPKNLRVVGKLCLCGSPAVVSKASGLACLRCHLLEAYEPAPYMHEEILPEPEKVSKKEPSIFEKFCEEHGI